MEEEVKKIVEGIENAPKAVSDEIVKDTKIVAGGIATGTKAVAGEIAKDTMTVVEGIEKTPQFVANVIKRPPHFSLKLFFKKLGPGIITGASDDDPSGIGTYSSVGARFGYGQIWLALYLLPLMTAIQEICARIGLVTDEGLAGTVKRHFSKKIVVAVSALLLIANTVNIGADLGAMAASARLIVPGISYFWFLIIFTFGMILLEIFVPYRTYAKILKILVLSLVAYIISGFYSHPDWFLVLKQTIVPKISLDKDFLMSMVAVMGTTISPYLFFWQTSEEVEEHIKKHLNKNRSKKVELAEIADMREDVFAGMGFATLGFFFIVVTTATVLFSHGITNIETPQQAAEALRPFAGDFASLIFTIGIIGTGLLGVPILAGSAAYALTETFNWDEGLYRKFKEAKGFYLIIAFSTIVGLLLNFLGVNPIKALFLAAVLNGIIAPVLMVVIMRISSDKKIMGDFVNSKTSSLFGWIGTGLMGIAAVTLILTSIF